MSDVLDRIRRELQQRLESTRAAAQEHERVRAALEALEHAVAPLERVARRAAGGGTQAKRSSAALGPSDRTQDGSATTGSRTTPARSPATAARRATGSRKPTARAKSAVPATAKGRSAATTGGRARSSATPARARAPRGANREAVLAVVRERPGVTASELAAASGVTGGTLYALLRRLIAQGELAKRDLPGGQTGYALASSDAPVTGGGGGRTIDEDGSSTRTEDAVTAEHEGASPANRP
jgi:hypothetical protein